MTISQEEGTRQDAQRLPAALAVRITVKRRKYDAVAVNLSEHGLCLRTDAPVRPDDRVTVAFRGSPKDGVAVKGTARWVFDATPMMGPNYAFAAGVQFDDPDDGYLALLAGYRSGFVEGRQFARVPHSVRVDVLGNGHPEESVFALNLGRQGLFVRYEHPITSGTPLSLRLHLPFLPAPIEARCEVVHVLDDERARVVGAPPGIGVRLVQIAPSDNEAYRSYVDFLEDRLRL